MVRLTAGRFDQTRKLLLLRSSGGMQVIMMRLRLFALASLLALPDGSSAQEILFGLDAANSQILRIDSEDGSVLESFPTPVLCRPEGPCGLAYSGISLYFADATDPDQRIYELNPEDGTIWNSIPSPTNSVDGLAYCGDQLYAMSFLEDRIYKLDPKKGTVLDILEPGVDLVGGLGAGSDRIFASRIRPGRIFELDPENGAVINELETELELPTGLALIGGRLFATDFEAGILAVLDPDSGELLESFDMDPAELAALASATPRTGVPYELDLELVEERLTDAGDIELVFRAVIQNRDGEALSTNDHSQIVFEVQGEGVFSEGNRQTVTAGIVESVFEGVASTVVRIEAQLSGLQSVSVTVGVVAPATNIGLSLARALEDSNLVDVVAELFDTFGEPAVEDSSDVVFRVASGAGVVVGPSVVVPSAGVARTSVRLIGQETALVVGAQVRAAERRSRLDIVTPVVLSTPPSGLTVSSGRVGGRDNLPPSPPADILTQVADDAVTLTWTLSEGDGQVTWFVFNGRRVQRVPVTGYSIYRSVDGALFEHLADVGAGIDMYMDAPVSAEGTYRYKVLARDRDNLAEEVIHGGTAEDRRRTVVIGEPDVPMDAEGRPVRGLFNDDPVVDFDDFFLFADNFGASLQDGAFDPLFDLNGNGTVDFDDFFIFADSFGREVVTQ